MNDADRAWSVVVESRELGGQFRFSVARVDGAPGELAHLDQPVLVDARGAVIVMLSVSGGMRQSNSRDVLDSALAVIMGSIDEAESNTETQLSRTFEVLRHLFEQGAFFEALPIGVIANVSDGGVQAIRFGPVGIAKVRDAAAHLLHDDDRLLALRRRGVRIDGQVPLLAWTSSELEGVTSLVHLDEPAPSPIRTRASNEESILLMSRGAFPISSPEACESVSAWARSAAGWSYGMSGVVVRLRRKDGDDDADELPWFVRAE